MLGARVLVRVLVRVLSSPSSSPLPVDDGPPVVLVLVVVSVALPLLLPLPWVGETLRLGMVAGMVVVMLLADRVGWVVGVVWSLLLVSVSEVEGVGLAMASLGTVVVVLVAPARLVSRAVRRREDLSCILGWVGLGFGLS